MSDITSVITLTATAEGVEAGVGRAKRAITDLGATVSSVGKTSGDGLGKLGDGAPVAAAKIDAATRNMIAAFQRQTIAVQAGGKANADYLEGVAKLKGLDAQALAPFVAQLRAAEQASKAAGAALSASGQPLQALGMSAKATAAAMRGVPAQITDIVVSLQGGQKPMTVLLQQGGQLKDMFGGIVPAARALAGGIAGMLNPITLAAAAIGGIAYVLASSNDRIREFGKTLIVTGNAAGATGLQLSVMAERIGKTGVGYDAASDALQAIVKNGAAAGDQLERVAGIALNLSKVTGSPIDDIAKSIASLADDPLKAAGKLNEQFAFLTAETLRSAQAFVAQGRDADATAVIMSQLESASKNAKVELANNAGVVERAWNGVLSVLRNVKDAILSIGREQDGAAKIAQQALRVEFLRTEAGSSIFGGRGAAKALAEAEAVLATLKSESAEREKVAASTAKQQAADQARVAGQKAYGEIVADNMNKEEKRIQALARLKESYEKSGAKDLTGPARIAAEAQYAEQVARTNEKFKEREKSVRGVTAAINDGIGAQRAAIEAEQTLSDIALKRYQASVAHARGIGDISDIGAIRASSAAEINAIDERIARYEKEIEIVRQKKNSQKEVADLEGKIATAAEQKLSLELGFFQKLEAAQKKVADGYREAYNEQLKGVQALEQKNQQDARQIASIGLSEAALYRLAEARHADAIAMQEQRIAALELFNDGGANDQFIELQKRKLEALKRAREDFARGTVAQTLKELDDYFDPAKAQNFGDALSSAFAGAKSAAAGFGNAVDDLVRKQAELAKELNKVRLAQEAAQDLGKTDPLGGFIAQIDANKRLQKVQEAQQQSQLQGYARIAGAAKGFFAENSKGYKALQIVEQVFTVASIAQSLARGTAAAATGVAQQAQGDPYSAFFRMAAMAAAMASLGFTVASFGGGGGSKLPTAASRQEAQGTGGVFGDPEAKSHSIANSLERLQKLGDEQIGIENDMLSALRSTDSAMSGLANLVVRSAGIATGGNLGIQTGVLSRNSTDLLGVTHASPLLQGIQSLWGKVKADITDAGLRIQGNLADLMKGTATIQQYADVTTTTSSFFGLVNRQSQSTKFSDVDEPVKRQFSLIFKGVYDSLVEAAKILGQSSRDFDLAVIDIPNLSLKGLKGEELKEAIETALSNAIDKATGSLAFPTEGFQRVGEGLYETVIRMASGVQEAGFELDRLGIKAINFKDIINKQGDVGAEIVRQSIMAVEDNGVGKIIDTLSGSAGDIAEVYQALLDVRNVMRSVGKGADDLSAAMIKGAGGLEKLKSGLDDYLENFFSPQEQRQAKRDRLEDTFAAQGIEVPTTREAFRQIVEGIDTTTEAGQKFYGQMMAVAGVFKDVVPSMADFGKAIEGMPFKELANLSDKAAMSLIAAAGGLESFSSQIGGFYQNFYSDAERGGAAVSYLRDQFAGMNVEMPTTGAAFREMVLRSMEDTTEAGQKFTAFLLGLQGTFYNAIVKPADSKPATQYGPNDINQADLGSAERAAIAAASAELKKWNDTLLEMPFDYLTDMSEGARKALFEMAGGLDNLSTKLSNYAQNFYSDAERTAKQTQNLADQFHAMGIEMPRTRDGFRALMDAAAAGIEEATASAPAAVKEPNWGALAWLTPSPGMTAGDDLNKQRDEAARELNSDADAWREYKDRLAQSDKAVEGANEQYAALLNLADAFAALVPATDQWAKLLKDVPLAYLADMSDDARIALTKLAGGMDQLSESLTGYYQNFYSDAERAALGTERMSAEFADLGLTMPTTRDAFRALVEGAAQDTSEAGLTLYAALLGLQGSFAALVPAAASAVQAAQDVSNAWRAMNADGSYNINQADLGAAERDRQEEAARAAKAWNDILLAMPFDYLSDVTDRARDSLAQMAGGMESLSSKLNSFAQNYYSDAERTAKQTENLAKQFAAMGLQMPKTRDEFRAMVEGVAKGIEDATANAPTPVAEPNWGAVGAFNLPFGSMATNDFMAQREAAARQLAADAAAYSQYKALAAASDAAAEAGLKQYNSLLDLADAFAKITETANDASNAVDDAMTAVQRSIDSEKKVFEVRRDAAKEIVDAVSGIFDTLKNSVADLYGNTEAGARAAARQGRAFIDQSLSTARTTGYLPEQAELSKAITDAKRGLDASGFTSREDMDRQRLILAGQLDALREIAGAQLDPAQAQLDAANAQLKALDDLLQSAQDEVQVFKDIDLGVKTVAEAVIALHAAIAQASAQAGTSNSGQTDAQARTDALMRAYQQGPDPQPAAAPKETMATVIDYSAVSASMRASASLEARIEALTAEVRQLRQDNSAENQAIASNTGNASRLLDRVIPEGDAVQTRIVA